MLTPVDQDIQIVCSPCGTVALSSPDTEPLTLRGGVRGLDSCSTLNPKP